jgi:hypothetical protein
VLYSFVHYTPSLRFPETSSGFGKNSPEFQNIFVALTLGTRRSSGTTLKKWEKISVFRLHLLPAACPLRGIMPRYFPIKAVMSDNNPKPSVMRDEAK